MQRSALLAAALTLLLTSNAAAGQERRDRCAENPFSQWCFLIGAGASIGVDNNNDFSIGVGARFGTFIAPHLGLSLLPGYTRQKDTNIYDIGLSADGYIPLGKSTMLVPGYYGGLFWLDGPFDDRGTVHGPHLSLLFKLGKHVFAGIRAALTWTHYKDLDRTYRDILITPSIGAAF